MTAPRPAEHGPVEGYVRHTAPPPRPSPERDLSAILVAVAFLAASLGISYPFINVYFAQVTHATTTQIGLIFSVASAVATLTTFAAPAMARRFGKLPAFVGTRLLTAPCLAVLAWHLPLAAAASVFLMRNILGNISGSLDNNFMLEILPARMRARASGWRTAVFNGCTAVTSYAAGLTLARVGYSPLFVAAGVLTVVAMAIYFGYFHVTQVRSPEPAAPGADGGSP